MDAQLHSVPMRTRNEQWTDTDLLGFLFAVYFPTIISQSANKKRLNFAFLSGTLPQSFTTVLCFGTIEKFVCRIIAKFFFLNYVSIRLPYSYGFRYKLDDSLPNFICVLSSRILTRKLDKQNWISSSLKS